MNDTTRRCLTIGMATYDDFDGVYFTVTSLMIHHSDVMDQCNIIVVDNNPTSKSSKPLKDWIDQCVPNGEYIAYHGPTGTAQARNEVFRNAQSPAVLCMDCHVLLVPGAIRKLIDYYIGHPESRDLLSGPLLTESGEVAATHQRPEWSQEAWGVWDIDERGQNPNAEPFEIWQQGMGLFSCRKDAWVGFHSDFRGFGGCESYVMEKFRRQGGRILCCPWLGWTHRFQRPQGLPYPVLRKDKLRNYVIGFQELGIDIAPVVEHFGVTYQEATRLAASNRPPSSADEIAVVGTQFYGGVRMRGNLLARYLTCKLLTPDQLQGMGHRSTIIAVKDGYSEKLIRRNCDRLIYDPLDDFCSRPVHGRVEAHWQSRFHDLAFDDIIATSPECRDAMQNALPASVRVHLVPHAFDPRINASWADPHGPIAYSGLGRYIESGLDRVRQACKSVGRNFVMGESCDVLRGASLALALRLPPHDTELNRRCKPQVKLANALAAGLPVVSTDCPAAVSLHPDVQTVPIDFSATDLAQAIERAYASRVLPDPYHPDNFLAAMNRILGRQTTVVYTGIFGSYDQLRDPRERLPGVQYICFTDNPRLKSDVWSVRYLPPTGDPQMQAKACKVLAHQFLDCDVSLWIDGCYELQTLNGVLELPVDLAMQKHSKRNCIFVEAAHCQRVGKGDPRRIDGAIARYRAEGHPADSGLWMAGIILRRHTPAIKVFNLEWWKEISQGTARDQISLPVVLRRLALKCDYLSLDAPQCVSSKHLK